MSGDSTKGHWQRPESAPGVFGRNFDAIDWSARSREAEGAPDEQDDEADQ